MADLIDREATLAAIEQRARDEVADANHYYLMGFQDAAETVENMPKAELTTDCISRQAAVNALIRISGFANKMELIDRCEKSVADCEGREGGILDCIGEIEDLPAVIPEPSQVARDIATIIENEKDMRAIAEHRIKCAHCKRYDRHNHRCKWWNHGVSNVDWCSYAERITDE